MNKSKSNNVNEQKKSVSFAFNMLEPNFHELEYKTAHRTKSAVNFESYIKKTQGTGMELNDELIKKIGDLS